MKKYIVQFTHVIERTVTVEVQAIHGADAILKAQNCEWENDDEETAPEQGIETKDYKVIEE